MKLMQPVLVEWLKVNLLFNFLFVCMSTSQMWLGLGFIFVGIVVALIIKSKLE